MNEFILGIDYRYRDDLKYDTLPIELLTEQYFGVIFRYTNISIKEDTDQARVRFDFEIISCGKNFTKKKALKKNKKFKEFLFRFLVHMMDSIADNVQPGDPPTNEDRASNTKEPDQGSELH